jgi:Domain of unknown function (DUF5753)
VTLIAAECGCHGERGQQPTGAGDDECDARTGEVDEQSTMVEQLHHLLRMSRRSYLTLRVVPAALGGHAGIAGPFMLMEFAEFKPVAYLDSETACLFLEKSTERGTIEVAPAPDRVLVRDFKDPDGSPWPFPPRPGVPSSPPSPTDPSRVFSM